MKNLRNGLDSIVGGTIYQHNPSMTVYVLSKGDVLELPNFTIGYPEAEGLSNLYTINGKQVRCKGNKEDNVWNKPSPISNSRFPRNRVIVHTDGNYLYIEDHQIHPYDK